MTRMVTKIWALIPLLLVTFGSGISTTNPGLIARITQKGLNYVNHQGMTILQRELSNINLQNFNGDFKAGLFGKVNYNFYSLINKEIHLGSSYLSLLPGEGIKSSISGSTAFIGGRWKIKKFFITLLGTFDLKVKNIYISTSLRLSSDDSGRLTASVNHCEGHIGQTEISISGDLSWLLNLFQNRIGSSLRSALEEKICGMVRSSVTSYLLPYLQTLQVTVKVDEIASLDYRLLGPPQINGWNLDVMFKGEFFSNTRRSPVPFDAPSLNLPQENNHMVYFGISDYLFNTASAVYQEAGAMNFFITDAMIPPDCDIRLNTFLFKNLIPELTRAHPNMQMEFHVFPAAFQNLTFGPGNMTIMSKIHVEAFVILSSTLLKSVFWLTVRANVSAIVMLNSNRISGSIRSRSQLTVELKHSDIGWFNVVKIEKILNFLTDTVLIPIVNERFQEGFPLPLPKDTYFYDLILLSYKNFLLLGANLQ